MKNICFYLFIATLTIAASCSKENPEPYPPITTCGVPSCGDCEWNVFRCKVNGEDWCANCEGDPLFGCDPVDCQYYPDDNKALHIRPVGKFGAYLYSEYSIIEGDSVEIDGIDDIIRDVRNRENIDCYIYNLDTLSQSYLYVSNIDLSKQLIEGSFEFVALNECQDTLKVTDGYFKLTYRP